MDMQQLFAAAQQMQEQLMNAQQALADAEVTGTAGGGLVKATVNGQGELLDLSIAAAAVDADDAEETARTIADLVLAAVRRAAGYRGCPAYRACLAEAVLTCPAGSTCPASDSAARARTRRSQPTTMTRKPRT
jgi:DNA-binding YbaB/EbfC family protein